MSKNKILLHTTGNFEIYKKIKVCYILMGIQCVFHVDWDWGSHGPLEKYVQETRLWKEDVQ